MNRSNVILIFATAALAYIFLGCCDDCPTVPQQEIETRSYVFLDSIPYINELDCDQAPRDTAEFIELFTVAPNVPLDGHVVVFYNGNGHYSYQTYDLDGYSTNANGFFVLGTSTVPNVDLVIGSENIIQNGPEAIALYEADGIDFPPGTYVTNVNCIDAIVYGTNDYTDGEFVMILLLDGTQLDEDANGTKDTSSLQRIPNAAGGYRSTTGYRVSDPTPGADNK